MKKQILKLAFCLIASIVLSASLYAHTWEIGVRVWNGSSFVEQKVCLKRIGGGYDASCISKLIENSGVNWAVDIGGCSPANCGDPQGGSYTFICCMPRVQANQIPGTFRLYVGQYFQEFTITKLCCGDILLEYNTTTNAWSVISHGDGYIIGPSGMGGSGCLILEE